MPRKATPQMSGKNHIYRAVHRHDWRSLEEWVRTLQDLSDLDDPEIEELVRMAANDAGPARRSD